MYRLCVIGDPVAHSRSPAIHTALLQQRGLTVRLCHPGGVLHRERSGNPHILSGFHRLIFIDERRRHP